MGIDIYMHWDDMTDDEVRAQFTGFDTTAGNVGYLREAYHGGPYATETLVPEAFEWTEEIGNLMSCAKMAGTELPDDLLDLLSRGVPMSAEKLQNRLGSTILRARERIDKLYPEMSPEDADLVVSSYISFVDLALEKQAEGKCIYVYASH